MKTEFEVKHLEIKESDVSDVDTFRDRHSALMLVYARLRHVVSTRLILYKLAGCNFLKLASEIRRI